MTFTKRLLLDTNILLDVVLARKPHAEAAEMLWAMIEEHDAEGRLAAHAITTFYYLLRRQRDHAQSKQAVHSLLQVFKVATVDGQAIHEALRMPGSDFEDCVTAAAAHRSGCTLIVTRDPRGFKGSPVEAVTPEAAIAILRANPRPRR
jgi:predicted nucleic acid-binding protein